MGIDEVRIDKVGIDEVGINHGSSGLSQSFANLKAHALVLQINSIISTKRLYNSRNAFTGSKRLSSGHCTPV